MNKSNFAMAVLASLLAGCSHGPVQGILYSEVQYAEQATSNQSGTRMGESCASSYLGLIAVGDSSIETARRNGGINMITSVDQKYSNYLVYQRACTVVRGR